MTEQKPSRIAHVPAILAGSAALIAALSTLYVNLRGDAHPAPAPEVRAQPVPAVAATASAAPVAAVPVAPQAQLLRLDRVQVDNDGSLGSTDWSFQVSVDGEPLFSLPMPGLSDEPGENLARPADPQAASAELKLPADKSVVLSVDGWKKGWLPGSKAEVTGKAWVASGFDKVSVTLQTDKPKGPRFVLYFSAAPAE
jgi:hypothetical protein